MNIESGNNYGFKEPTTQTNDVDRELTPEEWQASYDEMTSEEKTILERIRSGSEIKASGHIVFKMGGVENVADEQEDFTNFDWEEAEKKLNDANFTDENIGQILNFTLSQLLDQREYYQREAGLPKMAIENPAIIPAYVKDFKECNSPKDFAREILRHLSILDDIYKQFSVKLDVITGLLNLRTSSRLSPDERLSKQKR